MVSPFCFFTRHNLIIPLQIVYSRGIHSVSALIELNWWHPLPDTPAHPTVTTISIKTTSSWWQTIGGGIVTHGTEPLTLHVSTLHQENISLLVIIQVPNSTGVSLVTCSWPPNLMERMPKKKSHAGQSIVMLIVFSCPLFRWHLSPSKVQNPETPLSYSKSTKSIKRYSAKPRLVACLHIAPMTVQLDYWLVLCPRATVSTPAYQGNTGYGGIHWGGPQTGYIRPSTSPAFAGFFFVEKKWGRTKTMHWLPGSESSHGQILLSPATSPGSTKAALWNKNLHKAQSAKNLKFGVHPGERWVEDYV